MKMSSREVFQRKKKKGRKRAEKKSEEGRKLQEITPSQKVQWAIPQKWDKYFQK